MTSTVGKSAENGFPFISILTLIFVAAKLFGKITWSWWWVFSPMWIGAGVFVTILAAVFLVLVIGALLSAKFGR